MNQQISYNSQTPQKGTRIDEIRRHAIEQLNNYQSAIEELSNEELEEITGGVNKGTMFNYAARLWDAVTVGAASYSVHKTDHIFAKN